MVAIQMTEKNVVEFGWFHAQPRQLLVYSRTLGQHTLVDIVELPRAERTCLSPFVIDAIGRHVSRPSRIEEEFPLGVSI